VERLTNDIEEQVIAYLSKIETQGGMIEAINSGWFQEELARSAHQKQRDFEDGKRIVVGVNRFVSEEKGKFAIHRADPKVTEEMIRRVKKLREERDNKRVDACLIGIEKAAKGKDNLVPFVMDAVKAYATVGEICDVFRGVFGEHKGLRF
jgi:methylmalonyl-CoA mutase N-terminal domain/subunit